MIEDLPNLKTATIERCISRAREDYRREPATFATDLSRQDAAIFNIVRACDAALDMGHHLIHRERLGVPQSARDVFTLLVHGRLDRRRAGRQSQAHGRLSRHRVA